jgi:pilus assembly protein CpaB
MRAKTVFTMVFVVSLLAVAILGVRYASQKGDATVPKQAILAATMPLPAGTLLRAQDVVWQTVSVTEPDQIARPSAAVLAATPELDDQTRANVYGAVLRHPLAVGDPIRRGDIVKPGDRDFLQVVLTPGARAIAIPVATGGASTGLLTPGDFVDVILTQDFKDGNTPLTRRSVGETVASNLRVLAIDAPDAKGNFGRTVTLEVTAEQAELINVAAELGKLSLTLRSVIGPTTDPTRVAAAEHVRPKWAGDVSPALYGAGQDKPTPVTPPPPVQVLRGSGKAESVNPNPN